MLFLLVFMLGTVACVTQDADPSPSTLHSLSSVLFLFLVLGLTFSISLYGIKRLIEKSPKIVFGAASQAGRLPRSAHEVIAF
ncbi:hypothetical protein NECID01_0243 [Nematocida sp. AWRm77]|nr:hypothetical protein NECID01_0243 [Nematocida sp. AWRm77]